VGGDDEVDGVGLVMFGELLAQVSDGVGIPEEQPAAEGGREAIEWRDGFVEAVDGGGDGGACVEHAIEGRDCVLVIEEGVDDGIEDELASSSSHEPIMGQGNAQVRWFGGLVYHLIQTS